MLDTIDLEKTFTNGIKNAKIQNGGLFNNLIFFEANGKKYIFKQYMNQAKNEIYKIPNISKEIRYTLALDIQELIYKIFLNEDNIIIPSIFSKNFETTSFIMDFMEGHTFINFLEKGSFTLEHIKNISSFLGKLHQDTYLEYNKNEIYKNEKFRNFKLELQYDNLKDFVTIDVYEIIMKIKEDYLLNPICVLHSDLNSRNILIDNENIVIIDFEQSHIGSPEYDLAYIFSEIYMSSIFHKLDINAISKNFLDSYFDIFNRIDRKNIEIKFKKHLGIQIIYRIFGPSRAHWSYYLDESTKEHLINISKKFIKEKN